MAVSFTKDQLVVRFPEFADVSAERVTAMLEMARDYVDETALGSKALTGLMLYTAHLLSMTSEDMGGKAGPITAERVGDLSTSYGQAQSSGSGDLDTSNYGRQYRRLIRHLGAGGSWVIPGSC